MSAGPSYPAMWLDELTMGFFLLSRVYNVMGRTYLFDLDFWHLQELAHEQDGEFTSMYSIDAFNVGNVSPGSSHRTSCF